MGKKPRVSLIFVNYQSVIYLKKALESLFLLETKKDFFEVIVVNNDISEKEEILSLSKTFPIHLVFLDNNSGFGTASNAGSLVSQGDILGFINPDTLWVQESLPSLAHFLQKHTSIGVLGMMMYTAYNKEDILSFGSEPTFFSLLKENIFGYKRKKTVDFVSGGALFITKRVFEEIGRFDENFFLYFEDVDLCQRVKQKGLSVVRNKDFPIIHLGGKSQNDKKKQKKEFYTSQRKYFQKHRPIWEQKALSFCQVFLLNKNI